MGHDISHNPHPALPKNKGRDAPFGFEATAGWVAMSHPRSCRDRHCSSSPWGFVQKKLLVSLCLDWWWSGNWLRAALDMQQWSQINRWRGVLERHHCTTVILSHPHTHPRHRHHDHGTKVCPKFQPQQSTFNCLIWKCSACHPTITKQPGNPPEVKYSLSPSSSDQLLEQHLSDMAPMTAPYSSVSTRHACHRGFIGSKLRLMGVGWGTLISCHEKQSNQ